MQTEDVLEIFRECGAMLEGHFVLTSGLHSPVLIMLLALRLVVLFLRLRHQNTLVSPTFGLSEKRASSNSVVSKLKKVRVLSSSKIL